jgi:hypothetical protein
VMDANGNNGPGAGRRSEPEYRDEQPRAVPRLRPAGQPATPGAQATPSPAVAIDRVGCLTQR